MGFKEIQVEMAQSKKDNNLEFGYVYLNGNGRQVNRQNALIRVSCARVTRKGFTSPHMHQPVEIPKRYTGSKAKPLIKEPVRFVYKAGSAREAFEVNPEDLVLDKISRRRIYRPNTNGFYVGASHIDGENIFDIKFKDLRDSDEKQIIDTHPIHCDYSLGGGSYDFLSVVVLGETHGRGIMGYIHSDYIKQIEQKAKELGIVN